MRAAGIKYAQILLHTLCFAPSVHSSNGSYELSEAEALVTQVSSLKVTFDACENLAHLCKKAQGLLINFACFRRLLTSHGATKNADTDPLKTKVDGSPEVVEGEVNVFPEEFARRLKLNTADSTPRVWLKFYEEICNVAKKLPFVFPESQDIKNLVSLMIPVDSLSRAV